MQPSLKDSCSECGTDKIQVETLGAALCPVCDKHALDEAEEAVLLFETELGQRWLDRLKVALDVEGSSIPTSPVDPVALGIAYGMKLVYWKIQKAIQMGREIR